MEATGETFAYARYLDQISGLGESDDMITIPPEVLREARHEPILAQFIFNPFGPTMQTLSIARTTDTALPSMLLRRSLNPHAEPYQVPIGLAYGTGQERALQEVEILALFLEANGVGSRETSTPFVTATPCAIVLGPGVLPSPEWLRSAYLQAASRAELDLDGAVAEFHLHGTDLWAAADASLRSGMQQVLSVFGGDAGGEGGGKSERGELPNEPTGEAEGRPTDEAFAEWWRIVTGKPMIRATLKSFPLAWNGPGPMAPDFASVELENMLAWMELFAGAWERTIAAGSESQR